MSKRLRSYDELYHRDFQMIVDGFPNLIKKVRDIRCILQPFAAKGSRGIYKKMTTAQEELFRIYLDETIIKLDDIFTTAQSTLSFSSEMSLFKKRLLFERNLDYIRDNGCQWHDILKCYGETTIDVVSKLHSLMVDEIFKYQEVVGQAINIYYNFPSTVNPPKIEMYTKLQIDGVKSLKKLKKN